MNNNTDMLLVTTSRSILCINAKTGHSTKLHTGRGLYYGITSDDKYIYIGVRNRLVSSKIKSEDERGMILKFDNNLQLLEEIQPHFPLKDIHQIRIIDHKLYVTCTRDNMIAVYDGDHWEQWYPNEFRNEDKNHFNSLYHDEQYIYLLAHNWGDSEIYVFDRKNREFIKKIKIGKCAHNVWLDENNTFYTLSSDESKLVDSHNNTTLMLEGFPRGIVTTDDHTYIGISERAERNIRDFVNGKILIFDKQKKKTGELVIKSEGMVLDIRVINQKDHISNEYTRVNQNIVDNIHAMDYNYEGSRESIKNHLRTYLPLLMSMKEVFSEGIILDMECRRGVWLELLEENGIQAKGIATDKWMFNICQDYGLNAIQGDGIEMLREQSDDSLMVVSAFYMIGNTPLDKLREFVTEALRTLKPGGLLLMETPNLESIKDDPGKFYIDPSYTHSIPQALLSFIENANANTQTKIIKLQEPKALSDQLFVSIRHMVEGVSSDCAIIVQRETKSNTITISNNPSFKEYDLSPLDVFKRFETWAQYIQKDIDKVDFKASEARQSYHNLRANELAILSRRVKSIEDKNAATRQQLLKLEIINTDYHRLLDSTSWKITKPMRNAKNAIKRLIHVVSNTLRI